MKQEQSTFKSASKEGIEWLFSEFSTKYGARLADLWRGTNIHAVKDDWAHKLAGYSVGEVRAGLAACMAKPWPPSLPEFLIMCRPPVDFEATFIDAQLQTSKRGFGEDVWPSKAVYWAAIEYGQFQLRNDSWMFGKNKWKRILAEKLSVEHELPEVPDAVPSLPAPGAALTDNETARGRLAGLKAGIGRVAA